MYWGLTHHVLTQSWNQLPSWLTQHHPGISFHPGWPNITLESASILADPTSPWNQLPSWLTQHHPGISFHPGWPNITLESASILADPTSPWNQLPSWLTQHHPGISFHPGWPNITLESASILADPTSPWKHSSISSCHLTYSQVTSQMTKCQLSQELLISFFCFKFWTEQPLQKAKLSPQKTREHIVHELCESRGGRPELSVLTSLLVSMDIKNYWTMLWHWSQLVPNMSTDIWGH